MKPRLTIALATIVLTACGGTSTSSPTTQPAATVAPTVATTTTTTTTTTIATTSTVKRTTTTIQTSPQAGSLQASEELLLEYVTAHYGFDTHCWIAEKRGGPGCPERTARFAGAIHSVGELAPEYVDWFEKFAASIEASQAPECRRVGACLVDGYATFKSMFDPAAYESAQEKRKLVEMAEAQQKLTVTYSVTGVGMADITYSAAGNNTSQVSVSLPWSMSFAPPNLPKFLYVSAQIKSTGAISCAISDGTGRVLTSNTSNGQYVIVTCTGS